MPRVMANETKITEIVGEEAYKQLEKLNASLITTKTTYAELAKEIANSTNIRPKTYEELDAKMKSYDDTMRKFMATQNELAQLQREQISVINKLNSSIPLLTKSIESFLGHVNDATNALGANTKASNENATAAKNNAQSSQQTATSMGEASKSINDANKSYQDILKSIAGYDSSLKSLNNSLTDNKVRIAEIRNNIKDLDKQYKRHIINEKEYKNAVSALLSEERSLMEQNKQNISILREHAKVSISVSGSYYEMNAAVLALEKQYKNLGQAARESSFGQNMVKQIDDLKNKLKTIDASLGNYQRNVGNYASQWNGLQYQFQMVARELPNLGINLQTFIISLSNNLPYLIDELQKASVAHKEYVAAVKAGNTDLKAVPSVFKQAIGAIFNWQTAIIVAITLITAYRKEIAEWIGGLFGAEKSVKELIIAEEMLAISRKKGISDTIKERTELKILYYAVKDITRADKEREIALRQLAKIYPETFANITKESVAAGELDKAYQLLTKSIIANATAKSVSSKIEENESKKIDKRTEKVNKLTQVVLKEKELEKRMKEEPEGNRGSITISYDPLRKEIQKLKDEASDIQSDIDNLNKANANLLKNINIDAYFSKPKKGTFDYWQQELTNAKDALKQFDSDIKKILDDASENNKDLYNLGIDKKIVDAYKKNISDINEATEKLKVYERSNPNEQEKHLKYLQRLEIEIASATAKAIDEQRESELANIEAWYQKRLSIIRKNGKKTQEEIDKENELRVVLEQAKAKKIQDVNDKFNTEIEKADIANRLASIKVTNEYELAERTSLLLRQNEILRIAEVKEAEKTGKDVADVNRKYARLNLNILSDATNERIRLINEKSSQRRSALEADELNEYNANQKAYNERLISEEEFQRNKVNIQIKYNKLALESQADAILRILLTEKNLTEKQITEYRNMLKKLKAQIDGIDLTPDSSKLDIWLQKNGDIINQVMELWSQLRELGNNILQGRIENIEAEQEANQEAGEKEQERIEELAESGAISEEEAEARKRAAKKKTEEKDKELERQKAELQIRQAKLQKDIDIGNIIAMTAVAIMSQLKTTPLPLGAPMVALIAATGAAQLATVLAQPLPKYAKGTDNHPGGLAVVGDGGKREAVLFDGSMYITPAIPTVVELPKGAKVIPELPAVNDMEYLRRVYRSDLRMNQINNELNGYADPIINNHIYMDSLDRKMDELIQCNQATASEFKKIRREISKSSYIASRGL